MIDCHWAFFVIGNNAPLIINTSTKHHQYSFELVILLSKRQNIVRFLPSCIAIFLLSKLNINSDHYLIRLNNYSTVN